MKVVGSQNQTMLLGLTARPSLGFFQAVDFSSPSRLSFAKELQSWLATWSGVSVRKAATSAAFATVIPSSVPTVPRRADPTAVKRAPKSKLDRLDRKSVV